MQSGNQSGLITLFIVIVIFSFISLAGADVTGKIWKPLPLRTQGQKDANMPGGEGMQTIWSISYAPITPSNPDGNVVYMLSNASGVWKSTDGGNAWESKRGYFDESLPKSKGFMSTGGYSLVVDPLNENVVFVSSSTFNSGYSEVDGIYRTVDGGNSWDIVRQTRYEGGNLEGQHFVFDPGNCAERCMTIYAATHKDGLLKSESGGDTWTALQTSDGSDILTNIHISDIELHQDTSINSIILYVATNDTLASSKGLYKVIDDGSGTATIEPLGNLPDYPRTIALDPNSAGDIIYAAVGAYGVFRSTDGGDTFESRNGSTGAELPGSSSNTIDIHNANSDYLFVTMPRGAGQGCKLPYYSHDGGETWYRPSDLNVDNLFFQNLYFWDGQLCSYGGTTATHPTNQEISLYSFQGTIFKTTTGGDTWRYSGNGYMGGRRGTGKTSMYVDPLNPDRKLFFLTDYSVAETLDNGSTWELLRVHKTTPAGTGDPDDSNVIITARGSWYSQAINRGTYDEGTGEWTWTIFDGDNSVPDTTGNYRFISYHPQDSDFVYAGAIDGSWISEDDGVTWTKIENKSIRAVDPGNGNIVYAFEKCEDMQDPFQGCNGTWTTSIVISRGELQRQPNQEDDIIWERLVVAPFGMSGLNDVDTDPLNSNRLYVATGIGLYIFNADCLDPAAGCLVWNETGRSGGIESDLMNRISVQAVVADPVNPDIIYVGVRSGYGHREEIIYRSDDGGLSWNNIPFDGGYSGVWALSIENEPVTQKSILHMNTSHGNYVLCTDNDGDGFAADGGLCGPVDIDDNNPAVYRIDDLYAHAQNNKIKLMWSCVLTQSGAEYYNIYRSTEQDGPYDLIEENHYLTEECKYFDQGLTEGITYYYVVRWKDSNGYESSNSNEAGAVPH